MRRKRLPPKPQPPENGIFIHDPEAGGEVFVSFNELKEACISCLQAPDELTGKPYYKSDPTYNVRKK